MILDYESIISGIDEGAPEFSSVSRHSDNNSEDGDMDLEAPMLLMPPPSGVTDAGSTSFSPPMITDASRLFDPSAYAPSPMREHEIAASERSSLLQRAPSITFMDAQGRVHSNTSSILRYVRPKLDAQRIRSRESLISHGHKEGLDPVTGKSTFGQSVWNLDIIRSGAQ